MSASAQQQVSYANNFKIPTRTRHPPKPLSPSFNRRKIPSDDHNHPDDILDQILPHRHSIDAFYTHHQPTSSNSNKTVNPSLTTVIRVPDITGPEPNWSVLVSYYISHPHSLANLQDFYTLLTRAMLPNAIIDNRRLLLYLHIDLVDFVQIPLSLSLRWDQCPNIPSYVTPAAEDTHDLDTIGDQGIFAGPLRTPDGTRFLT